MASRVYLSLGSNLGDRAANLRKALTELEPRVRIVLVSSMYETEPVGVTTQPTFLNIAAEAETDLEPHELLRRVKDVERRVGRRKTYRWGPRVVDIDILLYGDRIVESRELTVPHRELPNRAFVLVPLAEIAPDLIHPTLHETVSALRDRVPGRETVARRGESPVRNC
jgi:2-amino-4-hydroxy-6-hydroxymethyldihydropteridine diphosphokinase